MRLPLLWTPQAHEDLIDIYVTIGLDNASAAERVYSSIEERASLLITQPRLGFVARRSLPPPEFLS